LRRISFALLSLACALASAACERDVPPDDPALPPGELARLFQSAPTRFASIEGLQRLRIFQDLFLKLEGTSLFVSDGLVSSDPLVVEGLSPGTFRLQLLIASREDDERVAAALVEFTRAPVRDWVEAGWIAVDSGTAALFSKDFAGAAPSTAAFDALLDSIIEELARTQVASWSWAQPPSLDGAYVGFSAGWGDGRYRVYVGRSASSEPAAVLVDFEILFPG
jgi:hypothetical protein